MAVVAVAAMSLGAPPASDAARPGPFRARAGWVDPVFQNTGGPAGPPPDTPIPGGQFTDDGVITFGDAHAASGGTTTTAPIVAMAATPSGHGYWMVSAAGQVVPYGDALSLGSFTGAAHAPVIGMAATHDGLGYWIVDLNGGVSGFGDAVVRGSTVGRPLGAPIVAMAATPTGHGYWLVGADGAVFNFGDAPALGSMVGRPLYAP